MKEHALRELIDAVEVGHLSRRRFVQTMIGLGLTAPLAAQMLAAAGPVQAQPKALDFTPTRRGGGGPLRTLWWQAPTLLNPRRRRTSGRVATSPDGATRSTTAPTR